jgi:phosphoglycolate phosphatase-like HAD superfamily hydrolase
MIRLALFDIDGTLARTGGAGVKAFGKVFETEFKLVDGLENLKFAGRTDVSIIRDFFNFHDIAATTQNFQRFYDRYVFWLDHILKDCQCEVIPGVWEFIHGLQELPEPPLLGLLTGNIRLGAEIKLRRVGLWETFATGAFADDHEERDHIAVVARDRGSRLLGGNLRNEEVLVIGDTPFDIRCGRAIGAKVLAVATGGAELQELKAHKADWAVADLNEVTPREIVYGNASVPGAETPATRAA